MSNAQSVTSAQVSSSVMLENSTPLSTAIAWLQKGQLDRGVFVDHWCKHLFPEQEVKLLFPVFMGQKGGEDDLAAIICAQGQLRQKTAGSGGSITAKLGPSGAVSLYGLGQWPLTLYASQWEKLLGYVKAAPDNPLTVFIQSNPQAEFEFYADEADKAVARKNGKRTDDRPSVKRIVTLSRKG